MHALLAVRDPSQRQSQRGCEAACHLHSVPHRLCSICECGYGPLAAYLALFTGKTEAGWRRVSTASTHCISGIPPLKRTLQHIRRELEHPL